MPQSVPQIDHPSKREGKAKDQVGTSVFLTLADQDRKTTKTTGKNNVKRTAGELARADRKSCLKELFSTIMPFDGERAGSPFYYPGFGLTEGTGHGTFHIT